MCTLLLWVAGKKKPQHQFNCCQLVNASNPGRGEIFCTCSDRPWGPPNLLYNGYRVFPRGIERPGRDADLSPLLCRCHERLSYTSTPPVGLRPVQSLSACTRMYFYLLVNEEDYWYSQVR